MAELIRKPSTRITRPVVEAALLRLVRYPGTTSVRNVMRVVDEYAASLHTDKVYKHADKLVGEALVQAAYAKELDKKISVEIGIEGGVSPNYVKKFFDTESTWKKFLSDLFSGADSVSILVSGNPTNPVCPTCTKSPISPICPDSHECPQCPICRNTPVRDTSGKVTLATPASGAATPVTDTRDTVTAVTDTPDTVRSASGKGALTEDRATGAGDKVSLATGATDTGDSSAPIVRMPMDCAPLDRVPEDAAPLSDAPLTPTADRAPKVDMATCESGKNEPDAGAPDALADGAETIKACTRCGRVLPLSAYVLARGRKGGRASACRECEQQRHRDYRAAKREQRQNGAPEGQKRPLECP